MLFAKKLCNHVKTLKIVTKSLTSDITTAFILKVLTAVLLCTPLFTQAFINNVNMSNIKAMVITKKLTHDSSKVRCKNKGTIVIKENIACTFTNYQQNVPCKAHYSVTDEKPSCEFPKQKLQKVC